MNRSVIVALAAILAIGVECGKINSLPGTPQGAPSYGQYAGYYTVGAKKNHQMHYWFVESQNKPATDPLIIWLTGGPGCSGLSALLTEWGPLMVNPDGNTLSVNPYAWNKKANILTLESPAGVGYSYSTDGDVSTSDNQTATENWQALVAFLTEFSQYKNNDFYVIGESYGGMYVPTLVQTILDNQSQFKINIKGLAIGNGLVDQNESANSIALFEYGHGMIDDNTWQQVLTQCCNNDTDSCPFYSFDGNDFCGTFMNNVFDTAWNSGINPYDMYQTCAPSQVAASKKMRIEFERATGRKQPKYLGGVPCMDETPVTTYLNRADVRKAIYVPSTLPRWEMCNDNINENYVNQYNTVAPQIHNAIATGLKVMIYSGDVDMACNFLMGQRFTQKLGYPVKQASKKYKVDGQIGGFHTQYGNQLHFVTVRGAGHMVPTDKPSVAFHILESFINNKAF